MANEVRIKVVADTKEAKAGMKDVSKSVEKATPQVGGLNKAFTGLTKSMALFGIGGISLGIAISGVIKATKAASVATASLELQYGRMPDNLKAAFDRMAPEFTRLSGEFAILEDDIAQALLTLLENTRNPALRLASLELVLARVALGYGDVASQAELVSQFLLGSADAIKIVTGNFQSLEEAERETAEAGRDAVTVFDQMSLSLQQLTREAGSAFDALSRGDYRVALEEFKGTFEGLGTLIESRPLALLASGLLPVHALTVITTDALKEMPGPIELIADLANSRPFDWIPKQLFPIFAIINNLEAAFENLRAFIAAPSQAGQAPTRTPGGGPAPTPQPRPTERRNPNTGPRATEGPAVPLTPGQIADEGGIFHAGGIVGGAPGSNQRIIAKAGEGVFNKGQMAAMGGVGGGNVTLIIEGDVVVDTETRMNTLVRKIQDQLTTLNRGGQGT